MWVFKRGICAKKPNYNKTSLFFGIFNFHETKQKVGFMQKDLK